MAVKIIDNCCSPEYLDYLKFSAVTSENWNLKYPMGDNSIDKKHLKLDILDGSGIKLPFLAGLAVGLLTQIYVASGVKRGLFKFPEMYFCGISIKDKHRVDDIHTDHVGEEKLMSDVGILKILGIINSDWKEEYGGSFFHDGTSNYIKPTSFCIFDPSKPHSATEIFTDKKRIAIDFTVEKIEKKF